MHDWAWQRPLAVKHSVVSTDQYQEGAEQYWERRGGACYHSDVFVCRVGGADATSQSSQHLTVSDSSSSAAKGLLGGVDHVEEAILVALLLVDLRDGRGHGHHAVLVDQQEEGLRGVQLQAASGRKRRRKWAMSLKLHPPACR